MVREIEHIRLMRRFVKVPDSILTEKLNLQEDELEFTKNGRFPQGPEGSISLRAASRKYGIHSGTLSRWRKKHSIPIILRTSNEMFVAEEKLLEVINLYKINPGQGKKTAAKI